MDLTVYTFTTSSGRTPVTEFLDSLSEPTRDQIMEIIEDFKTFGFQLPPPELKKLSGEKDLWELRIKYDRNIYRIFVASLGGSRAILLHAIQKKSQKTPRKDIKTAHKRLQIIKAVGEV